MPVPWRYSSSRCYRTVKNMRKDIVLERAGTHHNALADAESQAVHLMAILKATKGTEAT
jgi:exodeoxyribonuclease VIII